ncbi:Mu transposase domain-containing protein [Nocardia fluminea]|uniref:Transposase n=1 Tax=Nocardia fluminea TaxID=134984 RepID=A0A2N3VDF4_9NOCA|nr:DDE-type integrase/transposase/recombinase [Nocardia fluminea]PKV76719.1 transposase [Nocardia fluminea]PKV79621.1 transposase [Nocardia fluminea]PKV98942.1 transposase [Nocardia fluminea]
MLSLEGDVEVHALHAQGWTISAIARHLKLDRKTVRAYLNGDRVPGQRARSMPLLIEPFIDYCRIRLADDPHLWASTLFDEIVELGFTGSYPSLTTAIRKLALRPHCEPCHAAKGRDVAIIAHPPGEETQWDWVELPDPPTDWGVGRHAHLLVGAFAHSSRWRGVLAPAEDFAHLVEALDQVVLRLGGVTRRWRFDRMATVCSPESGRITPAFSGVAKHYGVGVDICPPRHGNRKGVVEKSNHAAAQRWWRTVADDCSVTAAQASLDRLSQRLDGRRRVRDGQRTTVGELAESEPLHPVPATAYPAELREPRKVTAQGLVSWRGNEYSVPPGLPGAVVTVIHRLGSETISITTESGAVVAAHCRAPDGAGRVVRDEGHVLALERSVLAAFDASKPCTHKTRRPLTAAALEESARLRGRPSSPDPAQKVVIDLSVYAATAANLSHAPHRDPLEQQ